MVTFLDTNCLPNESAPDSPAEDRSLTIAPEDYSLLTDLYQLTMAACYAGEGLDRRQAHFEIFVRHLPPRYGYLIAMGLIQVIDYLQKFKFTSAQIAALQSTGIFESVSDRFWTLLEDARFTGNLWAVPEGTAVFANEPLLRVEAPLWQAQLIETYLLNTLNYQTLIATKAARMRDVAGPHAILMEFGTRRAFSPQAAIWAARAALAAGFDSTSNVLAAFKLGRKPTGTMAHALVMALGAIEGSEARAFNTFHHYFPGAPLLIDTYDTIAAARGLAAKLEAGELQLQGVRLDSGDLAVLSRQVRSLLPEIPIFASGDLDEWEISRLQAEGACLDGYGIGSRLVAGNAIGGVYKLVEIDGIPVMKASSGKVTYPGRKQIFRQLENGQMQRDRLGLADEPCETGEQPLLQLVVEAGKPTSPPDTLEAIAKQTAFSVASLPPQTRHLEQPIPPAVLISPALQTLTEHVLSTGSGVLQHDNS